MPNPQGAVLAVIVLGVVLCLSAIVGAAVAPSAWWLAGGVLGAAVQGAGWLAARRDGGAL